MAVLASKILQTSCDKLAGKTENIYFLLFAQYNSLHLLVLIGMVKGKKSQNHKLIWGELLK